MKLISRSGPNGFTLVELMIGLSISAVILAGGYNLFVIGRQSYASQDDLTAMYQTIRSSEQLMVREIRMAGYKLKDVTIPNDVPGTTFADGEKEDIEEASPQAITFTSDVECDGFMETVRYSLRDGELVRQMWRWDNSSIRWRSSGGARSVAEHVEGLHLSYLVLSDNEGANNDQDDDGDSLVDEEGELFSTDHPTKAERPNVGEVRLTMTIRTARPDSRYTHPLLGDHYRRMTLSTTITPRNVGL